MTDFKEIKRLYERYFNFENEIQKLIDEENYEEAASRVSDKNAFMEQLARAKKTASNLSEEEVNKIRNFDEKIKSKNTNDLVSLKKIKAELEINLKDTKQKVKVGNAYAMQGKQKQGVFVDIRE